MIVRYRVPALRDIDEIFEYLNERNPVGAQNVLSAIRESIDLIASQPHASQRGDGFNIRAKVVQRYRYKIFYRILDDQIVEIAHIRHTSRRPWTGG
jgi:plasmid stabilization system protein ParE